jgi:hypothetical protein
MPAATLVDVDLDGTAVDESNGCPFADSIVAVGRREWTSKTAPAAVVNPGSEPLDRFRKQITSLDRMGNDDE